MQEKHCKRPHREDGHPQATDNGHERNQICWHRDLRLLASRTVGKLVSAAEATQPVAAQQTDAWPFPRPPRLHTRLLYFFPEPTCCPRWLLHREPNAVLKRARENSWSDRNTQQRARFVRLLLTSNPEVATLRRHVAIRGPVLQAPFPRPSVDLKEGAGTSPFRIPPGERDIAPPRHRVLSSFYLLMHAGSQQVDAAIYES